jgi:MFS family permease
MLAIEKPLYRMLGITVIAFFLFAFLSDGIIGSFSGFLSLQFHPARLINDYTSIGGVGGALFNAALMGFLSALIVKLSGVRLSGPTIAAVFTIMGFALFGKTPLNSFPIIAGVFIAGRIANKPFKNYILFALFGTALGPVVSYLIAEAGLSNEAGLVVGLLAGLGTGIVLPAVGMAMLRMHEGYNLYNIGLTAGFFGLFLAGIFRATARDVAIKVIWNTEHSIYLLLLIPLVCIVFLIWGLAVDSGSRLANQKTLWKETGRLPSDFIDSQGLGVTLINIGILGLVASAYMYLVGAPFNGPTLGGLMTLMGFGAFGKHLKNVVPIFIGVIFATLLFDKSLVAPGPILAFLFATTLAPLAGEFGPLVGFAAGFVHLFMVEQTGAWHAGLDLYNNGFAGGLTATLFVAIIQWLKVNRD